MIEENIMVEENRRGYHFVGQAIPRIDARDKVTGRTRYPTDYYLDDMLWAKALYSNYAHARIKGINVEKARSIPGVAIILTHRDIPGHNGFGYVNPNWPVLCDTRVRYRGDALALIAAVDEETADRARELIEVEYQPLPVVDTPNAALQTDAPHLHESGNILYHNELRYRNVEEGLADSDLILEQIYHTPGQEHAFLETEGGIAEFDRKTGVLTVWCCGQYAFGDQFQIARVLKLDPEKIRIICPPTGGAFGGKTTITVQIHLALLAFYTGRPVRLHRSREESIRVNVKRHEMEMVYRLGASREGRLKAVDVDIISNGGAYDSLSVPVFNIALQAAPGPYRYEHGRFRGKVVYTNGAMGGAFRGFGTIQPTFALEQEMDKLAERLGMDPLELRLANALERGDQSALGVKLPDNVAIKETLLAARESELWKNREEIKRELDHSRPGRKHGVGIACAWMSIGMGPGRPDVCNVEVELSGKGEVILRTGAIEIGQGNLTAYSQMLAEALECDFELIRVVNGDTFLTPDAGTVTASRSILMNGNAILDAVERLRPKLIEAASGYLGLPEEKLIYRDGAVREMGGAGRAVSLTELAIAASANGNSLSVKGSSIMKALPRDFGTGIPSYYFIYITNLALIGVDPETGEVEVVRFLSIPDVGRAINRAGVEGQCEGAVVQGLGFSLLENLVVEEGEIRNHGFNTYIIPTALDVPDQMVRIVEVPEETGPFGAKGMGEAPICAVAPAIANAIHDAIGVRFNRLPITPEMIVEKIKRGNVRIENPNSHSKKSTQHIPAESSFGRRR